MMPVHLQIRLLICRIPECSQPCPLHHGLRASRRSAAAAHHRSLGTYVPCVSSEKTHATVDISSYPIPSHHMPSLHHAPSSPSTAQLIPSHPISPQVGPTSRRRHSTRLSRLSVYVSIFASVLLIPTAAIPCCNDSSFAAARRCTPLVSRPSQSA